MKIEDIEEQNTHVQLLSPPGGNDFSRNHTTSHSQDKIFVDYLPATDTDFKLNANETIYVSIWGTYRQGAPAPRVNALAIKNISFNDDVDAEDIQLDNFTDNNRDIIYQKDGDGIYIDEIEGTCPFDVNPTPLPNFKQVNDYTKSCELATPGIGCWF